MILKTVQPLFTTWNTDASRSSVLINQNKIIEILKIQDGGQPPF